MKTITHANNIRNLVLLLAIQFLGTTSTAWAFGSGSGAGCAAGDCRDCHKLERKEVASLLKVTEKDILSVNLSEVPGLWEVEVIQNGKTAPIMIDFSTEFLVQGRIFRLKPPSEKKKVQPPPTVLDLSKIPLTDALLIGKSTATKKIIVFDDPECQFCAALQPEMQKVVDSHPEVAFQIKMFPLTKIHPAAYEKARSIVCSKSVKMLEDSLAGKPVPPPVCDTDQIKRNLELGRSLGIMSTPTMIMPDGRVVPGSKTAEDIFKVLNGEELKVEEPKGKEAKEPKSKEARGKEGK